MDVQIYKMSIVWASLKNAMSIYNLTMLLVVV